MKKKLVAICLCAALLAVAVIGGTLAYFTDTDSADNVFTVGDVDIELTETKWEAGDEEAKDVYPGEALPKNPNVKNIGKNPCFIRVKVSGLDSLAPAGLITYETNYQKGALGDGWVDGEDGYFYYTQIVTYEGDTYNTDLKTTTTDLFDQIRIPTDVTNGYDGTYDVKVEAEAVQAQGACPSWSAVRAMELPAIKAWFATCIPAAPAEG